MTQQQGYYRYPTIFGDRIVFVCEDDLWEVSRKGGRAVRLTTNLGWAGHPRFSPDGKTLAFTGLEEGQPEIYTMPSQGGALKRLTYLGAIMTSALGWSKDGKSILLRSNHGRPIIRQTTIFSQPINGGLPRDLGYGVATEIAFGPGKGVVLARWTGDPARWKRYRGGRAGVLLVDRTGSDKFEYLNELAGNMAAPMWIGDRIYFISDHEGVGNIYSSTPDGKELKRHTHHHEFYARGASTDGKNIVYHAGGDLFVLDPAKTTGGEKVEFDFATPRTQTARKFVSPSRYLESYDVHPQGHSMTITSRGKAFSFSHWEGAVNQIGKRDGVRYRLSAWLADGKRIACISDDGGEEAIEIHRADGSEKIKRLKELDFGRPYALVPSPKADTVALLNNRGELWHVDLKSGKGKVLDRSEYGPIAGLDWSPDGRWIVYSFAAEENKRNIRLVEVKSGKVHNVTKPAFLDVDPVFCPDGKYIYFMSARSFDPVFDYVTFDYTFPLGMRLFLVTLQKDLHSPFVPVPRAPGQPPAKPEEAKTKGKKAKAAKKSKKKEEEKAPPIKIDVEGLTERVVSFPMGDGHYAALRALPGGKLLFMTRPIEGRLNAMWFPGKPSAKWSLASYDLVEKKRDNLVSGVSSYVVSADHKTLIYRSGLRLRAMKAGDKADDNTARDGASRKSGWIDLNRIRLSVCPTSEWHQMFDEAWRLQRENFWTEDLSGVDWNGVRKQYRPLVKRVGSRGEFSDLMWEVQGELGTSHAYEFGGDYRIPPVYPVGLLGADFVWDKKAGGYRVVHVVRGDSWNEICHSPLAAPGINVVEGDVIKAIDGVTLTQEITPGEVLLHRAATEVSISLAAPKGEKKSKKGKKAKGKSKTKTPDKVVVVKTLRRESLARYREWVEKNREYIHRATKGRVGYIHIPDCSALGYSEFHRSFIQEVDRDGLIVDVRYNGGGHVSGLLLEKLARRRIAYCKPRWAKPGAYPENSPAGPIVAITNEAAASDGDIFSHSFKLMGLGPLIGKRTWGGVIGINVRDLFVDRGLTTQPQYSFWFKDVGWGVENYGAVPDIEVEITPHDYRMGRDPQMDRAIEEIKKILKSSPPQKPKLDNRPNLSRPKLPAHRATRTKRVTKTTKKPATSKRRAGRNK